MNSTNWPAPNVWIFIAQMVEHCSANAEAMGSNPVEVPKIFFGFICNSLNCNNHFDDHIFIQNLYFRSSHHLHDLRANPSILLTLQTMFVCLNFVNHSLITYSYFFISIYIHIIFFYNLRLFCVIKLIFQVSLGDTSACATLQSDFK